MIVVVNLGNGRSLFIPDCKVSSLDDGRFLITNVSNIRLIVSRDNILDWGSSYDSSIL